MTGARIDFTLDDQAYVAAVGRLGGVLRSGVLRAIGVALVEEVNQRFEAGKDLWGVAWTPLNPAYAMIKRGPGILRESRMLQRSITFGVTGNCVAVGSNRIYAAVHQFGAVIKPKGAGYLAFKLGAPAKKGGVRKAFVHAKSVRIPARPYLGFGPNDRRAVMETLQVFVGRAIG